MLSRKNERIYSLCTQEANKSNLLFQHGCIATQGGKIIACGHNNNRCYTHNEQFLNNACTCHAEMAVMIKLYNKFTKKSKLNRKMKEITLYISRIKDEEIKYNSAPCIECLETIKKFNIKRIIFYLNDEFHTLRPCEYITTHHSYGQLFVNKYV